MKRILCLLLGCLMLAGCQPVDEEAAKAPVAGYLSAIHDGDLTKAATYESASVDDADSLLADTASFTDALKALGFGDAFNAEAEAFRKKETALAVDTYEIESVSGHGTSATVTVGITGVDINAIDPEVLMQDVQDSLSADSAKYGEENPDQTDQNAIYGQIGKMVFSRIYERIAAQEPTDKVLKFQVEKPEDSETWKIVSVTEAG